MSYYCEACDEKIKEFDRIFEYSDSYYHEDCVTLYPIKHVVLINGDFICEVDEDEIMDAYDLIENFEDDEEDGVEDE